MAILRVIPRQLRAAESLYGRSISAAAPPHRFLLGPKGGL